jgi:hypothetical protein
MRDKKRTWKAFTQELVIDFCNERGSRTFTLSELQEARAYDISAFSPENQHPFDKLRQQLQVLRNDGIITFEDNRGTYTLRKPAILKNELSDSVLQQEFVYEPSKPATEAAPLRKREYIHEIFARDRGWVKQAKETFGHYCLHPKCAGIVPLR